MSTTWNPDNELFRHAESHRACVCQQVREWIIGGGSIDKFWVCPVHGHQHFEFDGSLTVVPIQTPVKTRGAARGTVFGYVFTLPIWLIAAILFLHGCGGSR